MKKGYWIYVTGVVLVGATIILTSWRRKVANAAADFIDVMEIGNNNGFSDAVLQKMIQDVGWQNGESWCMYFVKAIYLSAFPKKSEAINQVLTPSTQISWKNAQAHPELFKVVKDGKPRKGDIIIWQSTKNAALGHTGIVLGKINDEEWYTVEGNSSFNGTREGSGVVKGRRKLVPGTVQGTLRYLGLIRIRA